MATISAGEAVIIATTENGGKTATCNVTVTTGTGNPEDPENPTNPVTPVLTTSAATGITTAGATLGGNITVAGTPPYISRGVCYTTTTNPTVAGNMVAAGGSGTGNFNVNLTCLTAKTLYYARAFAVYTGGTAYGNEITFTTAKPGQLAVLTTAAVTEITVGKAFLWGNVTDAGSPAYTERGFYLAAGHTPIESDIKVSASGTGAGTFSATVSSLKPGTTYLVRAYARSTAGIAWATK